jgi:1-deoxy-D-xylulose-5-phosphate synthase
VDCGVVNARFAKPLDETLILLQAARTGNLLTVEESSVHGGFGSAVMEMLGKTPHLDIKTSCLGLPDEFIEHGSQAQLRALTGIDAEGIVRHVREAFPELFPAYNRVSITKSLNQDVV